MEREGNGTDHSSLRVSDDRQVAMADISAWGRPRHCCCHALLAVTATHMDSFRRNCGLTPCFWVLPLAPVVCALLALVAFAFALAALLAFAFALLPFWRVQRTALPLALLPFWRVQRTALPLALALLALRLERARVVRLVCFPP